MPGLGLIFVKRMIFQAAAEGQKIGKLFSLVENYKILANYSQPLKQSTTDEIVGFVAALTKASVSVCPLYISPLSILDLSPLKLDKS